MKWQSGQPVESGHYLCAVVGENKPIQLYWDGSSWCYLEEYEGWQIMEYHVSYYMNLDDIPMPEGW